MSELTSRSKFLYFFNGLGGISSIGAIVTVVILYGGLPKMVASHEVDIQILKREGSWGYQQHEKLDDLRVAELKKVNESQDVSIHELKETRILILQKLDDLQRSVDRLEKLSTP